MDEDSELLRLQLEELLSGSGELLHQFGFPQSRREQDMRSILQEIYGMDSDGSDESEEASADVDEMEELRDLAVAFQFQAEENERSISHQSVINPLMRMMSMFMMPSSVDRERDLERQREESRRRRISELQRQHRLRQEAELRRRREEEERRRQEEAEAERRRQEERRSIDETIRGPPLLAAFVNFLEMMHGGSREREETNQRASQSNQEILRIREALGERRRQEEAESATPNTDRLSNVLRALLGAMFRPPAPQSLSQSQLNQLPSVQHRSSTHVAGAATSAVQCSICLSDYMRGEEKRVLPCDHNFHKNCVDRWLLTNATCPVCRASVHVSS